MRARCLFVVPVLTMLALPGPAAAQTAAERCVTALHRLDAAIGARDRGEIEAAGNAAIVLPGCDDGERGRLRRRASLTLTELADATRKSEPPDAYLAHLMAARRIGQVWQTLLALAEVQFAAGKYGDASLTYQEAFTAMNEAYPDEPPAPRATVAWTYQRAAETQMLAPEIAPPKRDGSPGGVDAVLLPGGSRNLDVVARPLPVTYLSNSAEMTADGKLFAAQWWDSLRAGTFTDLLLVGHTDPRGSDASNDPLSVRRAEVLAQFLRTSGFSGTIRTLGFGKRCPMSFSSGANYTQEQQWQILRRVEVIAAKDMPANLCSGQKPVVGVVLQAAK